MREMGGPVRSALNCSGSSFRQGLDKLLYSHENAGLKEAADSLSASRLTDFLTGGKEARGRVGARGNSCMSGPNLRLNLVLSSREKEGTAHGTSPLADRTP